MDAKMYVNEWLSRILSLGMKTALCALLLFVFSVMLSLNSYAAAIGIESPKACKQCSMDRTHFAASRMLITYDDGSSVGVCSIHCAATELMQNKSKKVKSLMAADYATKELIDARAATWVVGGKIKGVMTSVAKWTFAKEKEAQLFVQNNGGEIATFEHAMKAAEEEVLKGAQSSHKRHMHAGNDMN